MAGTSKRVNISLPEKLHALLQQLATDHYGGNLSRYLADAGLFYGGNLSRYLADAGLFYAGTITGGNYMDNYQGTGYIVLALAKLGYTYSQICQVLDELHWLFDTTSAEQASEHGNELLRKMKDDE
jgi:hypothetical protein